MIVAFQAINNVRVEMRLSAGDWQGRADVRLTMVAHPLEGEIGEVVPLGSVSLNLLATNLRTMDAALIHGLYVLDARLASGEFASIIKEQ